MNPSPQNDDVLNFLSWLITHDFIGHDAFMTPVEAMRAAGKAMKEIRTRADELLAKMAAESK